MDTKTKIMEAVIKECKNSVIGKISTVNISKSAGTSESNIYKIYKTKDNLLTETFLYIDQKVSKKTQIDNIEQISTIGELAQAIYTKWRTYLEFFAKSYSYSHYYQTFRMDNKLYTQDVIKRRNSSYGAIWNVITKLANNDYEITSQIPYDLFWTLVVDSTLAVAQRMARGDIELSDSNVDATYHILFDGIFELVTAHLGVYE